MKRALAMACSALCALSMTIQPALAEQDGRLAFNRPDDAHAFVAGLMDREAWHNGGREQGEHGEHRRHRFHLTHAQLVQLVRKKIKYVFVLYQENRSFDSYFGTFPGADGLYSQPAAKIPGFVQTLVNTDGTVGTISPFRIGPKQYAWDTDDIDHSHARIAAKMDVVAGKPLMDKFAVTEELKYSPTGNPSLKAKQFGELAMAYEDCDTVPFLWRYADRFVLFDHVFQDITGPSTPGNLSIFAAQTGLTQWALHPNEAFSTFDPATGPTATNPHGLKVTEAGAGEPVMDDNDPLWGSPLDPNKTPNVPVNAGDFGGSAYTYGVQLNQTYASIAINTMGRNATAITRHDSDAAGDLADIHDDISYLTRSGHKQVNWGWYEEGYDHEPTDPANPVDANGTHASYITHHNGPQYFGYVANNPDERANLHGLGDLFTALKGGTLPAAGGVFYVKGGFQNIFGLTPDNPVAAARANFLGDDDHPAYSDAQISEAMVAKAVNAIAKSKYWKHAAIIITWDDSEGDYDHVPPPVIVNGPDKQVFKFGPRVPLILISPYARTHEVDHQDGSQSSVVKFVDELFGLTPLALLPDELKGRADGEKEFGEANIGPADALTPYVGDLMGAFDPARLTGRAAPLPASYAMIPNKAIMSLPQYGGNGCQADHIVPTDVAKGIRTSVPSDFNPLPSTNPGV